MTSRRTSHADNAAHALEPQETTATDDWRPKISLSICSAALRKLGCNQLFLYANNFRATKSFDAIASTVFGTDTLLLV